MNYANKEIDHSSRLFEKVEVPYEKGKEELWNILSHTLEEKPSIPMPNKVVSFSMYKYSAAAIVLFVLGLTFFLRFYSNDVSCPKGERLSHILPDGSIIELNAESTLSYHPFWWNFKREVSFEGEAFFKVEKGERFTIKSNNGYTEILGTSFNIYSRKNDYKVFCKTGKIKVSDQQTNAEFIIIPGEMALINTVLGLSEVQNVTSNNVLAWQKNKFHFTSEHLNNVIDELARQYDVSIELKINNSDQLIYTGYFAKANTVEASLNFICKSFDLRYSKNKKGGYILYGNY